MSIKKAGSTPASKTVAPQSAKVAPTHPGETVRQTLDEFGITAYRLAKDIGAPLSRIYEILKAERGITADMALRLARYFGTTPEFWMNLQAHFDLVLAEEKGAEKISGIKPHEKATYPVHQSEPLVMR